MNSMKQDVAKSLDRSGIDRYAIDTIHTYYCGNAKQGQKHGQVSGCEHLGRTKIGELWAGHFLRFESDGTCLNIQSIVAMLLLRLSHSSDDKDIPFFPGFSSPSSP